MNATADRRRRAWRWGIVTVVCVGVVAVLAGRGRWKEPPRSFLYEVSEYEEVDPEDVIFSEVQSITPEVERLHALAAAADGRMFVGAKGVILAYDMDGAEAARYEIEGAPQCMAAAPGGTIFYAVRDTIHVVDGEGALLETWDALGGKAYITSLAANDKSVYAADAGNRVVLRFDHEGNVQARIGEEDPARDIPGFVVPSPYLDVALDPAGALWAVNPGRHGLESYRDNGDLITSWYRTSMKLDGFCGCCNPAHVAFRPDGSLVTAEKGLVRVKLYSADWRFVGVVAPPAAFREKPTGPYADDVETSLLDLAVDAEGRAWVLDGKRKSIRVFEEEAASQ